MATIRYQVKHNDDGTEYVQEIHKITVHRFLLGDVDDPILYASVPLYEWEHSEQGQFVMKHSLTTPAYHQQIDHQTMGYKYAITAELEKNKLSEFYLRWGKLK